MMIIVWVIAVIMAYMSLLWGWYRYTNNPSVVDVGWSFGLMLAGFIYLYSVEITAKTLWLSSILLFWGCRLGFYLWFTRIRHGKVDKRYLRLSQSWTMAKSLGFFLNFQLQGLFILIISLPWFFTSRAITSPPNWLDYTAFFLAFAAVMAETIADYQLQAFKRAYPGQVCNKGLWHYSRHPNYFFEWLTWCAFTLFALSHPYGDCALISPLMLYWVMTRLTAPLTENESIASRGQAYLDYQKKTSMFFPWRF